MTSDNQKPTEAFSGTSFKNIQTPTGYVFQGSILDKRPPSPLLEVVREACTNQGTEGEASRLLKHTN